MYGIRSNEGASADIILYLSILPIYIYCICVWYECGMYEWVSTVIILYLSSLPLYILCWYVVYECRMYEWANTDNILYLSHLHISRVYIRHDFKNNI